MATAGALLGVMRAAHPVFRSAHDRVAFAVHSACLAAGYSLVAVGSSATSSSAFDGAEETEVGVEGWSDLEGTYAFRYAGDVALGLCKSVFVTCTVMGDLLMVDAASLSDANAVFNLEIKVADYASEIDNGTYKQQFSNLEDFVEKFNSSILLKLSPLPPKVTSNSLENIAQMEQERDHRLSSLLEDPPLSLWYDPPAEIPAFGGSDLMPGPGAGIFGSRRDPAGSFGGSMLLGPNDPRWGRGLQPGSSVGPLGVPPGARFDPYGPPGLPGSTPNRSLRRPPGQPHPDLEHFNRF